MEKIHRLISKRQKTLLILSALLLLWIVLTLSYIFNNSFSFSVISYPGSRNDFVNFSTQKILAGQSIKGEFVAKENYLGIVTINFSTFGQVAYSDEDTLVFRIKEKGADKWYYQNTYKSGLVYLVPSLPFGFPKISDSKGKTYIFEIESLKGNNLNAVALNSWEPVILTRYQIPKDELLQSKISLLTFFAKRVSVSFTRQDVRFFSFIYSLPLLFYLIMFTPPASIYVEKILRKIRRKTTEAFLKHSSLRPIYDIYKITKSIFLLYPDKILLIIVFINIFFVPIINDAALIVVSGLWFYLAKKYKNTSRDSFKVALFLLILSPLILLFDFNNIAEKSATWSYMFLVIGALQSLLELKKDKTTDYKIIKA